MPAGRFSQYRNKDPRDPVKDKSWEDRMIEKARKQLIQDAMPKKVK